MSIHTKVNEQKMQQSTKKAITRFAGLSLILRGETETYGKLFDRTALCLGKVESR
jgi:hypothetical protein